jgi:hypothetical protein
MSHVSNRRLSQIVPKVVVFLVLVGLAAAARRAYVLLFPPQTPRFATAAVLDAGFATRRLLTFIHIVPASLAIILMPLQFVSRTRKRHLALHRWSGRLVVVLGFVVGISALIMSETMAIGGANETAATMLFALLFLIFLSLGFWNVRQGRIARSSAEWRWRSGHQDGQCQPPSLRRVRLQPLCHVLLGRTGLRLAHVARRQWRTQSS